jgi:ATP-binding cassette subfamily B protein
MQPEIGPSKTGFAQTLYPVLRKYIPTLVFDLVCAAATTAADVALPLIVRSITQLAVDNAALLTVAYVLRVGFFTLRCGLWTPPPITT